MIHHDMREVKIKMLVEQRKNLKKERSSLDKRFPWGYNKKTTIEQSFK